MKLGEHNLSDNRFMAGTFNTIICFIYFLMFPIPVKCFLTGKIVFRHLKKYAYITHNYVLFSPLCELI